MKFKLIALFILITGAVAAGVIRTGSTVQKESPPVRDQIRWYAKEAKAQGRQKVRVPAPLTEYLGGAGTITSDEAFTTSTVVIAHLISKESHLPNEDIVTWNKFIIDEVLSEAKELPCPGCLLPDPPPNFLPLQSGEFLIPKTGGTLNIDGVEVVQNVDDYPEYEFGQQYLLLIHLYPNGLARTFGGPVGVFRVVQSDKVLPIQESEHRVRKDFKEKYQYSLAQLRKKLKGN